MEFRTRCGALALAALTFILAFPLVHADSEFEEGKGKNSDGAWGWSPSAGSHMGRNDGPAPGSGFVERDDYEGGNKFGGGGDGGFGGIFGRGIVGGVASGGLRGGDSSLSGLGKVSLGAFLGAIFSSGSKNVAGAQPSPTSTAVSSQDGLRDAAPIRDTASLYGVKPR